MDNPKTPAQRLSNLQKKFAEFYPDEPLTGDVSAKEQAKLLRDLSRRIPHEHFHFVVDMPNFDIRDVSGVYNWLGYLELGFCMETYIAALHPALIDHQIEHAEISTARYAQGEEPLTFNTPLFSVIQAIRHNSLGKYLWVKRLVLPFQFAGNRLMSYLSYFTILGEYKGENLQFQYPGSPTETALGVTREIKDKFWERLASKSGEGTSRKKEDHRFEADLTLNPGAIRLLKMLVEYPNLTAQEVSNEWTTEVSKRTIEKYCRAILEYGKARFPGITFKTAKDVAAHIAQEFGT